MALPDPQWESSKLYGALVSLRTQYLKDDAVKERLLNQGLVSRLVDVLDRSNAKVIDVALSILGNLLMEELPRRQLRQLRSGLSALVSLLTNSSHPEALLSRAARACANSAQDGQIAAMLQSDSRLLPALVKLCQQARSDKTRQVVVRAFRILATTSEQKREAVNVQVVSCVAKWLEVEDEELLKASTKCLAHFTHGCGQDTAQQLRGDDGRGFEVLVTLMNHSKRSIWEAAMATLVNLSHVDSFRPVLGNAGVIIAMVDKLNLIDQLTAREIAHCVTALCLYCRESVNRMKLREFGGLRLFVQLLQDDRQATLHGRIINSLMQFAYDDLGLKVLLHYGIVPVLVGFLKEHNKRHRLQHDCAEEICREESDSENKEEGGNENVADPVGKKSDSDEQVHESQEMPDASNSDATEEQAPTRASDIDKKVPTLESPNGKDDGESEPSKFRVNSPSYQAVQHEFEHFMRIQGEEAKRRVYTNPWDDSSGASFLSTPDASVCHSPDRSPPLSAFENSPGYSPAYSSDDSPGSSPDRLYSAPQYEPSVREDEDNLGENSYSPVERFSEEEEDDEVQKPPQPSTSSQVSLSPAAKVTSPPSSPDRITRLPPASPPSKRARTSCDSPPRPANRPRSIFSPTYEPDFMQIPPQFHPQAIRRTPSSTNSAESSLISTSIKEGKSRIGWILQILSRVSQAEKPHDDLLDLNTSLALAEYLCFTKKPLPRAGRILTRLTKNLYSVMPFVKQRHISHLRLLFDSRPTLTDSTCQSCRTLGQLRTALEHNVSLLAETGFAEGQICHLMMRGSADEKLNMAISAPMVVRPRKLLRNMLLSHGGLRALLTAMDELADVQEPKDDIKEGFSHAVLSAYCLSSHLGVVSPNLKLEPRSYDGECKLNSFEKDVSFLLDAGSLVGANREMIAQASPVFEAMLCGQFAESDQTEVKLPGISSEALVALMHQLHGCNWCSVFENLSTGHLLELAALSDRYLLHEFNQAVSSEIVMRLLQTSEVVEIYEQSSFGSYAVQGSEESLSSCAVSYLLVGAMPHETRVAVFGELLTSKMKATFLHDLFALLEQKLKEQ